MKRSTVELIAANRKRSREADQVATRRNWVLFPAKTIIVVGLIVAMVLPI